MGANLKKVRLVGLKVRRGETVEYLNLPAHLDGLIQELESRETALLIVDPITAFTGRLDTHKNAEVRLLMMRLFELASDTGCAVLGITHWNKNTRESNSLYRIMGSLAFPAAVRAVMAAGSHPDDSSRRVLVQGKHNLSSRPDGIEYSITDAGPGEVANFEWGETLDLAADEMLIRTPGAKPAVDKGKELLSGLLAHGPVPQSDVLADAKAIDIGESSLKKAKRELGVVSERDGKAGRWMWRLPADDPDTPEDEGDAR